MRLKKHRRCCFVNIQPCFILYWAKMLKNILKSLFRMDKFCIYGYLCFSFICHLCFDWFSTTTVLHASVFCYKGSCTRGVVVYSTTAPSLQITLGRSTTLIHISVGMPRVIHPCTKHEEVVDTAALQRSNMGAARVLWGCRVSEHHWRGVGG